jgi:DNA-binding winged helix-turn-helix (wHTH) protein
MIKTPFPFHDLAERILDDLAHGLSVAITGLSNSGKSDLMRGLARPDLQTEYAERVGRSAALVYVDCNRAVAITSQAFYEVVLRSILEWLEKIESDGLASTLRGRYHSVTEADSAFTASLSFNLALSELCEAEDTVIVLLFDEFDEIYGALDERALLNLRALHDRFDERLHYVTATVRSLGEIRGSAVEGEFAELFTRSTYAMPLLTDGEAELLLAIMQLDPKSEHIRKACIHLGGGHPGVLMAVAQALASLGEDWKGDPLLLASQRPQVSAECLKIWGQLTPEEQAGLVSLVVEEEAGLPQPLMRHLEGLGLLRQGKPFSPLFAQFVGRRGRGKDIEAEGVHMDTDAGDVWVDGIRIPVLTDLEYRLLELLYERRDKLTDKYRIVTAVWGEGYLGEVDDARVEKLVSRLRSKIEADPSQPRYLITQRGRGYKLLSRSGAHDASIE